MQRQNNLASSLPVCIQSFFHKAVLHYLLSVGREQSCFTGKFPGQNATQLSTFNENNHPIRDGPQK